MGAFDFQITKNFNCLKFNFSDLRWQGGNEKEWSTKIFGTPHKQCITITFRWLKNLKIDNYEQIQVKRLIHESCILVALHELGMFWWQGPV